MNPHYKILEEAAWKCGLHWTAEVVIDSAGFIDQLMDLFPDHCPTYTHIHFLPVMIRTYHDSLDVS